MKLSHLDAEGRVSMVDVGLKQPTVRRAVAGCEVRMKSETLALLRSGSLPKGDAFATARVAGILAAKKTSDLIPLCHPLNLDHIDVRFEDLETGDGISIEAEVSATAKTGVEMEALVAAMTAALAIYDMAKASDPAMVIQKLRLLFKTGGKHDHAYPSRCADGK